MNKDLEDEGHKTMMEGFPLSSGSGQSCFICQCDKGPLNVCRKAQMSKKSPCSDFF